MSEKKTCVCPGKSEQFKELQPVLDKYAKVPGSLITILQKTQDIYGYLSVEAINHISLATGIKPAKIYGVATFYAQFRLQPVGKYLIMLCKGTACHVNGADSIEEAISEYLEISDGETTEDGVFTRQRSSRRSGKRREKSPAPAPGRSGARQQRSDLKAGAFFSRRDRSNTKKSRSGKGKPL